MHDVVRDLAAPFIAGQAVPVWLVREWSCTTFAVVAESLVVTKPLAVGDITYHVSLLYFLPHLPT